MIKDLTRILRECCQGDIRAQEKLYKNYYNYGMSIAVRYAGNPGIAGEILNDSFLKIFRNMKSFEMGKNFKPWFRKIIVHTAIDQYRRELKSINHYNLEDYHETCYQNHIIEQLEADDILRMLQQLADVYRIVFSLYELEGYSHIEIAKILGISESTSRSCLSRAKAQLRNLIQNNYEPQEKAG